MRFKFEHGYTNYNEWYAQLEKNNETARKIAIIEAVEKEFAETGVMTLAMEKKLVSCLHITTLNGKLNGFYSISTSVLMNNHCQTYAKIPGTICEKCYAALSVSNYDGLAQALDINYYILNNYLLSIDAFKSLPFTTTNGYARIESHGDVDTVICAMNYNRLCKAIKYIHFAAWTKNIMLWCNAFQREGKATNLNFIVSSLYVGKVIDIPEKARPYVDHVFTVYNDPTTTINCGARNCNTCRNCYDENTTDRPFYINEKLKGEGKTSYPVLIGRVEWKRENNNITLVFHDMTNDRTTTKHYKTERGARAAETKFYDKINRNKVKHDIENNM